MRIARCEISGRDICLTSILTLLIEEDPNPELIISGEISHKNKRRRKYQALQKFQTELCFNLFPWLLYPSPPRRFYSDFLLLLSVESLHRRSVATSLYPPFRAMLWESLVVLRGGSDGALLLGRIERCTRVCTVLGPSKMKMCGRYLIKIQCFAFVIALESSLKMLNC